MKTKVCNKCGKRKKVVLFYVHSKTSDGYLDKCKECHKAAMTKNRNENIDRIRQYDRERGKLPHRKAATARYLKKFRSDNPKCVAAHSKVARAIKSGRLVRPVKCDKCSTKGKVIGHHHDYNKPLDVIWLCQPCHKQLHRDTF